MKQLSWRLYREEDAKQVLALHRQMESRIGHKLDLPNLLREPVLVALVGEVDDQITHGVFVEAEAELCAIGANPLSAKQLRTGPVEISGREFATAEDALLGVMAHNKLRIVRSFVPSVMLRERIDQRMSAIERTLHRMGMEQDDASLRTFFRWLPRAS